MESSVPRRRRSPVPIVIATVFVDIIGFAMILPLLPSYAARLGGSPTSIGILVASYSLLQLVLAPLWGRASDRFGRRPVLLIGLTGSVVSYLLFAMAGSYAILLLSRIIDGASGASINVAQAYLADETRTTQRARAMGIVGAAVGVGFIVGPILGGITAGISPLLPGLLAAAITAINLLVAVVILPESRQRRQTIGRKQAIPVAWRDLAPAVSVIFLATLAFSVMYVVFPLFGEERLGATRSTVSYWFAFVGLVTAIVQGGLLGRLVRWLGEPGTARLGAALLAGGFVLVAPSVRGGETTWMFFAALAALGAGFGMAGAAMTGLVSRRTAADRQGRVLGLTQSATAMARIVGPIAAGAIMQAKSAEGAFLASAGMAAIALAIAAGFGRRRPAAAPTLVS